MTLTSSQQRALTMLATALGGALAWRAWSDRQGYDFEGRSVIITGGSRGLGLAMARDLASRGARLALLARNREELERATHDVRLHRPGTEVMTVVADVRTEEDTTRAVEEVIERCGHMDVLINNAGIIQVGPLDQMQLADFENAMRTHFWGPLLMVRAVLPHMRRQRYGRVVNVSSIGGRVALPHLVRSTAPRGHDVARPDVAVLCRHVAGREDVGEEEHLVVGQVLRHLEGPDVGERHPHVLRLPAGIPAPSCASSRRVRLERNRRASPLPADDLVQITPSAARLTAVVEREHEASPAPPTAAVHGTAG